MKSIQIQLTKPLIALVLVNSLQVLWADESMSVLDAHNHPKSPENSEIFSGKPLNLDASLSWLNRFNGDETFNESETLPQHRSNTMAMSDTSAEHSMATNSGDILPMKMDGMGVVKGIRTEQGKVKIEHGPIDKFGMPEMTMMFKVDDPAMLEGLNKGDEVGFNVDNSSAGFVVTHIMPMMAMVEPAESNSTADAAASSAMDATGVVKTIRAEQGKVKIEHGPIDKYGMPAMTMVFKVQDPAALEMLEKGMEVEFDIDSSSGGFEITNIKPIGQ